MNILQISFHTSPFSSIGKFDSGGLNVYVQQISKHLSKTHNLTVVTAEKAENFKTDNLSFHSMDLFEPGLNIEDKEIFLQEFKETLSRAFELQNYDIIHAHYWLSGLIAKQISDELNIPYVFTAHSLGVFLDGYNKERVDCEKMVMESSNIITASSKYESSLINNSYDIDEKSIMQIPPGIDKEIFTYDSNLERENILLSVGRIQEQKRQMEVLKFIDNFRKIDTNFLCYFVGGPSGKSGDDYLIELKNTVKELNLDSNVEFLGNLTQTEIKILLNRSKLLIHTSQYETFGLVAIEANAMGVPVLTTNRGSLMEIIEHNNNGYISENLIDGRVNNFVKNLLTDDKKFKGMSKYCLEKSKKYDWVNTSEQLVDMYEGLI